MSRGTDRDRFQRNENLTDIKKSRKEIAHAYGMDARTKSVRDAVDNSGYNLRAPQQEEEGMKTYNARVRRMVEALLKAGFPFRYSDDIYWIIIKKKRNFAVTTREGKQVVIDQLFSKRKWDKIQKKKVTVRDTRKVVVSEKYADEATRLKEEDVFFNFRVGVSYNEDYYIVSDEVYQYSDTGDEGHYFGDFHYTELREMIAFLKTTFSNLSDKGKISKHYL